MCWQWANIFLHMTNSMLDDLSPVTLSSIVKVCMKSNIIPFATLAIIFLANLYLKQGIGKVYVMVDAFAWAYSSCKESDARFTKWKSLAHDRTRNYIPWIARQLPLC